MGQALCAVMLGGRIKPSPLRQALDFPILCLPMGRRGVLLDAWLDVLAEFESLRDVQIVVNTDVDVESVNATLQVSQPLHSHRLQPRAIAEPAAWRGPGGLVRDVTEGLSDDTIVIVSEAKQLPPRTLTPLLEAFERSEKPISGVVGICGEDEPAGVYAFTRKAISVIPSVGYSDLKEQFLPALHQDGARVVTVGLTDDVLRIRDRDGYLNAIEISLRSGNGNLGRIRTSDRASVSGSAILDGSCVIESGAVIEDGAVVQDSVVLWGATVGGGAVVSRSIIGPLADVEPRRRVIREIVTRPSPQGLRSFLPGAIASRPRIL